MRENTNLKKKKSPHKEHNFNTLKKKKK